MEKIQDPCIHCHLLEAREAFLACQQDPPVGGTEEHSAFLDPFKRLCDASFDGAAIFGRGVIVTSNRQFAEMFGYTVDEIQGMNALALCADPWHGRLKEALDLGCHESSEVMGLRKDGVTFPVEIRVRDCGMDGRQLHIMTCRDRTSQKQTENQLFLKEEELKAVFEASMDCISVWDKDCKCLYANWPAIDYVNMTPDKVLGRNIREILSHVPGFMNYWRSRIEHVFETGEIMRLSDTITLEGKFIYAEAVVSPIRHPDGTLFSVSVVYRDMTEHKQAVMQLKASEDRLKRLSETSFEAILIHKEMGILDTNQKFLDMLGYTREDLGCLKGLDMIAPQSRDLVKKNSALGYEGIYEALGMKKDGTIFPIEIQGRESLVDGVAVRIVAIKDLTLHKEMQRQIAESEQKYRQLYESSIIPLYRTRISDGKLLECNLAMVNLLGYDSKEECLREYYSAAHYVDPAKRVQLLARLEREKSVAKYEIEFTRRNGTRAWAELTARMNYEEGYVEGGQIDITASKVLGRIEKEILILIMQGKSNKEIARLTHRSIRTVEDHRSNMMKKLGAGNLVELVKIGQFLAYQSEK